MPTDSDVLRISLLQTDIAWNDPQQNLSRIGQLLARLEGTSDLAVLPETCTTGFTLSPQNVAEPDDGPTICQLKGYASQYELAIAGSFAQKDSDGPSFHNRAFLITPEGQYLHADKHHLFRIGGESRAYSPGAERPIFSYRGWNIALFVCYDLRFPVWSRNTDLRYDLALYVANWPAARTDVWDALLTARALENQAYVCGVNRVGNDGNDLHYDGHSALISPRGEQLLSLSAAQESIATAYVSRDVLRKFRNKFPVWKDADPFQLKPQQL